MRYENCNICGKIIDSGYFCIHESDGSISYSCNDIDCYKKQNEHKGD